MLFAALNAIFATAALGIAMQAFRKGLPFVRDGWTVIQAQTREPDFRENVERRRAISEGGRFLVGGLMWLLTAIVAFVGAIYFSVQAFNLVYGGG
jgi:hypothetical protein